MGARREKIDWVHSEGVYEIVPMQECKDAGMNPLDLISVDTDKSVDPTRKKFDRVCVQENTKRKSKERFNEFYPLLDCPCNATSRSCEGACFNHDVGEFVEQRETIEVETLRHQLGTFPRNSPETYLHRTFPQRTVRNVTKTKLAHWSRACTNSGRFPHLAT